MTIGSTSSRAPECHFFVLLDPAAFNQKMRKVGTKMLAILAALIRFE
jgi:hypothetical protein